MRAVAVLIMLLLSGAAHAGPGPTSDELLSQCPSARELFARLQADRNALSVQVERLSGLAKLQRGCSGLHDLENGLNRLYGELRSCQGSGAVGLDELAMGILELRIKYGQARTARCS